MEATRTRGAEPQGQRGGLMLCSRFSRGHLPLLGSFKKLIIQVLLLLAAKPRAQTPLFTKLISSQVQGEKRGPEIFSVTSTQWAFNQCFLKPEHWSLDPASWASLQEPSIAFRFHLAPKFGGFFFLEKLLHDLIF